jgi:thiaminase/transcriptional activator TenA
MTGVDSDGHGLAARLWEANRDLAMVALGDRFVRGLADGSLPAESFKAYVAQDAFFLEAFARAYALALARSPDRHGLETFHTLITGVLDELRLHASYAARWGVDPTRVEPGRATLAYTDFLLATASLGSVGETCAAMTPCMRLYAFLGQALAAEAAAAAQNPYHDWIETYAASGFEDQAATLEGLLERYAEDRSAVCSAYRRAKQLELTFFGAYAPRNSCSR